MPKKIGLIGYGGFGQFLHNSWSIIDDLQVVAIADKNINQFDIPGGVRKFSSWKKLIHQEELEIIAIATPPKFHYKMAHYAMKNGKNVLIEKPLALKKGEAKKLIAQRNEKKVVAGIDFVMRFNPLLIELRQLIAQNVFGKLRHFAVHNYAQDEQLPESHWFWNKKISGGIIIEHGIHFIDLLHFLDPREVIDVKKVSHYRNEIQEDQVIANILYNGGLFATHYHSFARPGFFEQTKIHLGFDLAQIELEGWIPIQGHFSCLSNDETRKTLADSKYFKILMEAKIDSLRDDSRPEGWGSSGIGPSKVASIISGGLDYRVDNFLSGSLNIGKPKDQVYKQCVQDSMLDIARKIDDKSHTLTAPLEAGLKSLSVALG